MLSLLSPPACGVSDTVVKVRKGQSVKLPCTYSVRQVSDISVMCWGQGMCPISKCSNEIVRTDGWKVTSAQSHRYQLHGAIANGDVSLTISNVGIRDKGMYCCRIEIPGLFNDIKRNLNLKIDPASLYFISALTTRATTTAPPLTTTAPPLTSMAVLPRPTTPPTTPTSDLPATTSSPTTTIFQSTPASTEDGFIFSTTELVLQTADTTTSATTTTTAPPLAITAALPEPTTAPVTPTSDLPATTPSPTTT
uniref:Ig-like domain-containing protein n=1 Tax=Pelodiscus sinensis TaxID=13735 RepID=K7F867_PELSI